MQVLDAGDRVQQALRIGVLRVANDLARGAAFDDGAQIHHRHVIRDQLKLADLVIGSVLIPGAKAPRLVGRSDLKLMKPGSVIIDVCIDQGGCFESSRPTTHSSPTYIEEDVVHYCVTNMPGAVGRTSTFALCNVTLPWALVIANRGVEAAAKDSAPIASAINIHRGQVTNQAVAETFGMTYKPLFGAGTTH